MYIIAYESGSVGCPEGGIFGKLIGYCWNSNDFDDPRFPVSGQKLVFKANHRVVDTDFFYFGTEFICSENFFKVLAEFSLGRLDVREVEVHQNDKLNPIAAKKYFLLRSLEIREVMDRSASVFTEQVDPRTGEIEIDSYHPGRPVYEEIKLFSVNNKNIDLDFFVAAELITAGYVLSSRLVSALVEAGVKGADFLPLSEIHYDVRLDF